MKLTTEEYLEATKDLNQLGSKVSGLLHELLLNKGLQVHSVTYRVKDADSAIKKLAGDVKYVELSDITDLLGLRIITYFPDDVDKVAIVLEREFSIDRKNSIDKRKSLDPEKFGYLSLHYVASLNTRRRKLIEYKRFNNTKFEIQIRSILQHAWAEIYHDLGYKVEGALPDKLKRDFSKLAGLLELADEEFERIRQKIHEYEEHVTNVIEDNPQSLSIDQSTVLAALATEDSLTALDNGVAMAAGRQLAKEIDSIQAGSMAAELKYLGITNIRQLILIAEAYSEYIIEFAKRWFSRPEIFDPHKDDVIWRGIGLFYLCYVVAAQLPEGKIKKWGITIDGRQADLLKKVRQVWDSTTASIGPSPDIDIYI